MYAGKTLLPYAKRQKISPDSYVNPWKGLYPESKLRLDTNMPYRKLNKRKRKKKRGVIKKRLPRAIQPRSKLIRLKTSQFHQFTGTTGALSRLAVQGNSCDDPYTTGSDQQPLGYDQWKALYKSAYVIGSKVSVTFHNESTVSAMVGISPTQIPQGTTPLASYEYYKELPGTTSRLLSPDVDHCYIQSKRSTKKFLHLKNMTDEEDYKMDLITETPPDRLYYYHIWTQATDQATTVNVEAVIDVEYIILLRDPIIPSRSIET